MASPNGSPSNGKPDKNIALPDVPDAKQDLPKYLQSINSVRERCKPVFDAAQENSLQYFDVHFDQVTALVRRLAESIKDQCNGSFRSIPPHGRWQHFEMDGYDRLDVVLMPENEGWPPDKDEATRRILDLFVVSVLLDAGAGNSWSYKSREGLKYNRSEGLAVASLEMFTAGVFSSNEKKPMQVDAEGLQKLNVAAMRKAFQVTDSNPMDGLEGRVSLLVNLAEALSMSKQYFGEPGRPGQMLDFLHTHPMTKHTSNGIVTPLPILWEVLIQGLAPVWPEGRTVVDGVAMGDVWPLRVNGEQTIVPFHKLTQWMAYSLLAPLTRLQNIHFAGDHLLTGLPEYRNGGLFIDYGVLTLKEPWTKQGLENVNQYKATANSRQQAEVVPTFRADEEIVVEWRAVTVGFLDYLLVEVNKQLGLQDSEEKLSLAQMLEAGTWKLGRQVAAEKRPETQCPPIMIVSDGTIF